MATIRGNISVTLNGVTPVTIGGVRYVWDGAFLPAINIWADPAAGTQCSVTIGLRGNDWNMDVLTLAGATRGLITDHTTSGEHWIGAILLYAGGNHSVSLMRTGTELLRTG